LILLRATAGGIAAVQGGQYLTHVEEPTAGSSAVALLLIVSAIGLITGFMTPGAAVAMTVGTILMTGPWAPSSGASLLDGVGAVLVVADALALAVLGPGAYSVDAYLFGRREIVIPDDLPDR
jgi:uncharacterized membrane protein YphA (DoxX/SURF4 family)